MAASIVTARNTTLGILQFPNMQVTIGALATVGLTPNLSICEILNDTDLQDAINVGDVVLGDGTNDLLITDIFLNLFEDPASATVSDADGDTGIEVEFVADDDIIRFSLGDSPGPGPFTNVLTMDSSGGFLFNSSEEDLDFRVLGDSSGEALLQLDAGANVIGLGRTSGTTLGVTAADAFIQVQPIGSTRSGAIALGPYNTGAGQTSELRFLELSAISSRYVGFKAPDALAGNQIWTLPIADGTPNQVLETNGLGSLGWANNAGSVDLQTAYDNGEIIAVTDVDGPVEINDSPLTTDFSLLRLDKDFAGTSPAIDIDMGVSALGVGIAITSASAVPHISLTNGSSGTGGTKLSPNSLIFASNFLVIGETVPPNSGNNGYDLQLISGYGPIGSTVAGGNGGHITLRSGTAGNGSAGFNGGTAGQVRIQGGNAGNAVGGGSGGIGGPVLITGGNGGQGSSSGPGGSIYATAGIGGSGGSAGIMTLSAGAGSLSPGGAFSAQGGDGGFGFNGGSAGLTAGSGGADVGAGAGAGAASTITGGAGGNALSGAFSGGSGGDVNLIGGIGGTSTGGAGGSGSNVLLVAGVGGIGLTDGNGGDTTISSGVGAIGGDTTISGGASTLVSTVGGFSALFGGPGAASAAGGPTAILGGPAGSDSGSGAGSGGSTFTIGATGGSSSGNGAGVGGSSSIRAGNGGPGDAINIGGAGGDIRSASGRGADSVSGGPPGNGGSTIITSGQGGQGSATFVGGVGGNITLSPGYSGNSGGLGFGDPGSLILVESGHSAQVGIGQTPLPGNGESKLQVQPSSGQSGAISIDPFGSLSGQTSELRFAELAANGFSYVGFKAPDSLSSNQVWTLPSSDGLTSQALVTDGSGTLSFAPLSSSVANYYDAIGGQTINAGAALSFNTIRIQDADYTLNGPGTQILINATGRYEIEAVISARMLGGTRGTYNTVLQLDTGAGFANIPGTISGAYGRSASNQGTTVSTCIIDLLATDQIRVFAQQVIGTSSQTIPNGTCFKIKRIS